MQTEGENRIVKEYIIIVPRSHKRFKQFDSLLLCLNLNLVNDLNILKLLSVWSKSIDND